MSSVFLVDEIYLICLILLFMLIGKLRKASIMEEKKYFFYLAATMNILLILTEFACGCVNGTDEFTMYVTNWVMNILYFIISSLTCYIWFLYSGKMLREEGKKEKHPFLQAVPMLVLLVLIFIAPVKGLLFTIDHSNNYCRGPLFIVQTVINFGYLIFASAHALITSKKTKIYRTKIEGEALALSVVPVVIFGCTQVLVPEAPTLCIGATLSLVYVYLSLQEQAISIDSLTGLNNRTTLYSYLNEISKRSRKGRKTWILLLDVDKFKKINDDYGHYEGDHALKIIAECMKKACISSGDFVSRYGGDEFVIVHETAEDETPEKLCSTIHENLRKQDVSYPLSISIGMSEYNGNSMDLPEILATADTNMYIDKFSKREA